MTGDFVITREHLLALGACIDGVEFFDRTYQDGRAEYQDMLDKAVDGGHTDYASWLLAKIGPTEDTLEVDEINSADTDVVFAGSIRVRTRIVVGCIEAGGGIEAGRGIEAGWGFGVYAGLHVRITETDHRTIKAASKPDNIMCGVWEDA